MVRFFIFSLSVLLMAVIVEAKEGFYCIPSVKSTWIYVEKKSEVVVVIVKNPMGYQQMPQFDGPTAPSSLPFQKMQFEDLTALGDEFTLEWPLSKCEFDNIERTLFCNGAANKNVAGIESYGLSTVQVTEKYKSDTYQKNRYRINFEKDGNIYFSSLEFYSSTCVNLKSDSPVLHQKNKND